MWLVSICTLLRCYKEKIHMHCYFSLGHKRIFPVSTVLILKHILHSCSSLSLKFFGHLLNYFPFAVLEYFIMNNLCSERLRPACTEEILLWTAIEEEEGKETRHWITGGEWGKEGNEEKEREKSIGKMDTFAMLPAWESYSNYSKVSHCIICTCLYSLFLDVPWKPHAVMAGMERDGFWGGWIGFVTYSCSNRDN